VSADGLLARVSLFGAGPDSACLQCSWSREDYDALEQVYACTGAESAAPTNAPASLGALAAALQVLECAKLLGHAAGVSLLAHELLIDVATNRQYVTELRRNPFCRMPHAMWGSAGKED